MYPTLPKVADQTRNSNLGTWFITPTAQIIVAFRVVEPLSKALRESGEDDISGGRRAAGVWLDPSVYSDHLASKGLNEVSVGYM